jgi:hypothetical protein
MAPGSTAVSGVDLSIPERGLEETLRAWSGKGQLWEALAAAEDGELAERRWTARDVERRANRILFADLVPLLSAWPANMRSWVEALPVESVRERVVTPAPTSGTSWRETRLLGWPPRSFVGHTRSRIADTLLVTTLRWTLDELTVIRADAVSVEPTLDQPVRSQMDVVTTLLGEEPVASADGIEPARSDIAALRSEGRPWNTVASVAELLRTLNEASLQDLARRLVMPDDDLRWRLFHLGVLGELLLALRRSGCTVESLRPLSSASTTGPSYRVWDDRGRRWDLWFEAAGVWSLSGGYGRRSPYTEAAAGVVGGNQPLGADLMLIRPFEQALVVECKYSADTGVVARGGYEQALAYATEARTRLVPEVTAVVVGPEEVVHEPNFVDTFVGEVGVVPPRILRSVLLSVLDA